jgi:microcompartment protein CcmK/EutM
MLLGRIAGTVVASRKEERLEGVKLLLVRQLEVDGQEASGYVVAVDAVGAGVGEVVLFATGSSARQTVVTHERPCDAVVMAIVDTWEIGGREVWSKSAGEPRPAKPAPARQLEVVRPKRRRGARGKG